MASSITARGVAATVGVSYKLGRSIAHKFAHERYTVAILAGDLGRLSRFADEIAREEKAQDELKIEALEMDDHGYEIRGCLPTSSTSLDLVACMISSEEICQAFFAMSPLKAPSGWVICEFLSTKLGYC
ncbi:hypothetical protein V6N11_035267 [Hibiscus sabdariffa]|uniref:Uncharacterized protein n=1 Tax=Hibiscus sabdariffa TaxID=183260 RepID=A0ABR2QZV0_9ROSI